MLVCVLGPFLLVGALALSVLSYLRVGPDAAALRDSVAPTAAKGWHKQVEFGVGWFPLALARTGLRFAPLDPEARLALRAVRGADVAVYQRSSADRSPDRGALLLAADQAMTKRGWDRMVGVVDRDDLVAVYVPRKTSSPRDLRACVLVLEPRQLVVVSGRANLEPLLELARNRPEWQEGHRLLQVAAAGH